MFIRFRFSFFKAERIGIRAILLLLLTGFVSLSCYSCSSKDTESTDGHRHYYNSRSRRDYRVVRFLPQWTHQTQFAGFYVALEKGIYERFGLDVIIQNGGPNAPVIPALSTGSTDFSTLFLLTAMRHNRDGKFLVNLGQISQKSSLMLAAKRERGIESIEDLNYKKIGLWHSEFRDLTNIFLQRNKLEVQVIPIDYSINLFLKGPIDAMNVMSYNELHRIYQAGIDYEELFLVRMSEQGLDIPEDGIYCTEEFFLKNNELSRDFAEATMEGWLYAINHEEEALEIVLDIMRRDHIPANRPHQRWMLQEMRDIVLAKPGVVGKLQKDSFDQAQALLLENGQLTTPIEYKRFVPNAP